jgi:N utilization substance protein A
VLGKAGIKTLDDLADLATDELIAKKRSNDQRRRGDKKDDKRDSKRDDKREESRGGVLGEYGLSEEQGNEIIMAARAHWFDDVEEAAHADSSQ